MRINLVGIDHETAPVALREKLAVNSRSPGETLLALRSYFPHGVLLSTCNRTEVYTVDAGGGEEAKASLEFFKSRANDLELLGHVYIMQDSPAVEHLFRVASGLESMIVGEFEVLGQVKQALEAAAKAGLVNSPLRSLFQGAVRAGRRVRRETGISKSSLSISSVAVDLAANIVHDLARSRLLIIGVGEAGRLVVKVARERGVSRICIAGRTRKRAEALAEALHGIPVSPDGLVAELSKTDIVVTCAAAPHRILEVKDIQPVMEQRAGLSLVIIDIALPRNVAPEVGQIPDVFLYNIDDLNQIAASNRRRREGEVKQAEAIVQNEVGRFISWWHDYEVRPLIAALMGKADKIRSAQLSKTLKKLPPLSGEERENLEAMTKSIVSRVLQEPIHYLKENGANGQSAIVKELFRLNMEDPSCGQK